MARDKDKKPKRPTVTCDGLGDLNAGAARLVIDQALLDAAKDLEHRGHDGKARTVTITITMQKKGELVLTDVQTAAKVPAFRTDVTACKLVEQGGQYRLEFQPDSADNPDQPSFYEEDKGD